MLRRRAGRAYACLSATTEILCALCDLGGEFRRRYLTMAYETLLFEQKDRVGFVTLNRPDRLNAVNQQMVREIPQLLGELKLRDDVGVVIVTGAGDRAFSAGADISEFEGVKLS